jgi:L-serine/L-threonine ammonia-lyase
MQLHIQTPLIESTALSTIAKRSIWLKLEAVQPPGSYKIRGVGFACAEYTRRGARRFISSSGGNAGIAVAYAGRHLNVPVIVVVPETATQRAKELIRQEGAHLIVHGASWLEANTVAQSLVGDSDAFIHPFDDPLLWQGHASLVDEIASAGRRPDAIVLSVGGGGLLCGVVEGLQRNGWADMPILAVETAGCDSLAQSLRSGRRVSLEKITSIATSLGAKRVCERAFEYGQTMGIQTIVVSDRSAVTACERFLEDQRILVEPACGAALALAYENAPALERFATVVFVVCGGVTATLEQLTSWSRDL